MINQLKGTDLFNQLQTGASTAGGNEGDVMSNLKNIDFKSRDNTAKYKGMKNSTDQDVQQLIKLDKEIEKSFNKQFILTNKNEEMLTNKLAKLDSYTVLREKLFKEVGNDQL